MFLRFSIIVIIIASVAVVMPRSEVDAQQGGSGTLWHDNFCYGEEICEIGDVNGDGLDDIVAFISNTTESDDAWGLVWVALSNGEGFYDARVWNDQFCFGHVYCMLADVNGDGKDDLINFARNDMGGTSEPALVGVSISNGETFGQQQFWGSEFCYGLEICVVGDFNGDGRDDIGAFTGINTATDNQNRFWVGLSSSENRFLGGALWSDSIFCNDDICAVGDLNGDGVDDIWSVSQQLNTIWGAVSLRDGFNTTFTWTEQPVPNRDFFCLQEGMGCYLGDYNGDEIDDMITFNPFEGEVYIHYNSGVPHSNAPGTGFSDFPNQTIERFCLEGEICKVGDFNGDGRADLITFIRSNISGDGAGNVYVYLAPSPSNDPLEME